MTIHFLTADEHREVLGRLVALGRSFTHREHQRSPYSNLMISFLLHELAAAESVLALHRAFGADWYPVTSALAIVRTLFEIDVNAHYISQDPTARALKYIGFGDALRKRRMDACSKHRGSTSESWSEGMNLEWELHWSPIEKDVNAKYSKMKSNYERTTENGKVKRFENWAGISIRDMAYSVHHNEAYDVFYSELSSFVHADVNLANHFLRLDPDGQVFTQKAGESDVGSVFRYAAIFLTCFLELSGKELKLWNPNEVSDCWTRARAGRST